MSQWVKDLALSLLWLRLPLWHRFDPWPPNFHRPRAQPKEKKNKTGELQPAGLLPVYVNKVLLEPRARFRVRQVRE